jgi:hypothetical protein
MASGGTARDCMSDPFYAPNHRATPAPSRPAEPLWTLTKGIERIACVVRDHGDLGCEIQVIRDGAFLYGRRFETRAVALQFAAIEQQMLERDGWIRDPPP